MRRGRESNFNGQLNPGALKITAPPLKEGDES
jgi:hypothetical protein